MPDRPDPSCLSSRLLMVFFPLSFAFSHGVMTSNAQHALVRGTERLGPLLLHMIPGDERYGEWKMNDQTKLMPRLGDDTRLSLFFFGVGIFAWRGKARLARHSVAWYSMEQHSSVEQYISISSYRSRLFVRSFTSVTICKHLGYYESIIPVPCHPVPS